MSGPRTNQPPTTLGSAAGAASMPPARKRGIGVWLGAGAVAVVAVIIVVVAMRGGSPVGTPPPPPAPADAGVAIATPADAATPVDATVIATHPPDAASTASADSPPVDPRPHDDKCDGVDVDALIAEAARLNSRVDPAGALAAMRKALTCKHTAQMYADAAEYACAAHKFDAARTYLARAPASRRRSIQERCDLEQKPVPVPQPPVPQPPPPRSGTQAQIAGQLNEEGKELMYRSQFKDAAAKFREAVARVPEVKYMINLGTAELQLGELRAARAVLESALQNDPTPEQAARAHKLIDKVHQEAEAQGIDLRSH
jgi:hypothetical protein